MLLGRELTSIEIMTLVRQSKMSVIMTGCNHGAGRGQGERVSSVTMMLIFPEIDWMYPL